MFITRVVLLPLVALLLLAISPILPDENIDLPQG